MMEPRLYRDVKDFERMKAILTEGRKAANGSYYVHVGDLSWWLFYSTPQNDLRSCIYLWEDPQAKGELIGWTLLSPRWRTFDVFTHPRLRGSQQSGQMLAWSVEQIQEIVRVSGGPDIRTMWIAEDDAISVAMLEELGFSRSADFMWYMARSLDESIPNPWPPSGYRVRPIAGEGEAQQRAAASHAAFGSTMPFEQYWQRYLRFMRSPVYHPDLDMMDVAPDGRVAAFCIVWLDMINRVGLFEPVGTHPEFQRKGLGKAVILEGLRLMKGRGMTTAMVCAESDNLPAQKLYETAGFQAIKKIVTYSRRLSYDSQRT